MNIVKDLIKSQSKASNLVDCFVSGIVKPSRVDLCKFIDQLNTLFKSGVC